jgi:hypothetical protein
VINAVVLMVLGLVLLITTLIYAMGSWVDELNSPSEDTKKLEHYRNLFILSVCITLGYVAVLAILAPIHA